MSFKSITCPGHNHYVKNSKPHVNVGTIGHVDHGKTTLGNAISYSNSAPVFNFEFSYLSYFIYLNTDGKFLYLSGKSAFFQNYLEEYITEYFEETGHRLFIYESLQLFPIELTPFAEIDLEMQKDDFFKAQYSDFVREKS